MQEQQRPVQGTVQTQEQATKQDTALPVNFPQGAADQLPTLAEWNNKYIDYVLNYTKGKKTAAARILGINRRTLYRRNKSKSDMDSDEMADSSAH